jgi:tetratricopeptide (TPR) repeat protein
LKYLKLNSEKWGWAYHNLALNLKFDFKRYEEAIIYYKKAIEQYEKRFEKYWTTGNPYSWSLNQLADIYKIEWFIDYEQSFYYRKRASDLGDTDGIYGLAIMYGEWTWCEKDNEKSLLLFMKLFDWDYDRWRWWIEHIEDSINKRILYLEDEIELEDDDVKNDFKEMRETLEKAKKNNWIFKLINFFKGK